FADRECTRINMNWSSTANLFYNNWLNFVYQTTPFKFEK
ncbi:MAG TPA: homoserine O-succinyltransferase, partial [Firmicutes bacterium]|nr:homoserine O-succinyltransferase [Bacillota bacterium]